MRDDQLHPNSEKSESDYHAIYMHADFCGIAGHLSLPFKLECTISVRSCTLMVIRSFFYDNQPRILCSIWLPNMFNPVQHKCSIVEQVIENQ